MFSFSPHAAGELKTNYIRDADCDDCAWKESTGGWRTPPPPDRLNSSQMVAKLYHWLSSLTDFGIEFKATPENPSMCTNN